nr:PREDICTED: uncharacterized protein LOC109030329 [Bemisia tabaci]
MGKLLKIKVFYKDDRKSAQRLLDLYAKVLQDCNDLNVEFVPTQLPAKLDSKIAAGITYISDPKELAHLPNGEDFDNVYLFVAVPSKIQIKSIVDTASKFKQKYAVIYEQQFNSHNYGLLKKNKTGQKWKVCHVSKSVLSTLDDLNSDGKPANEGFVLVVPKSLFVNPTVMMPKILKKARKIKFRCFFLLDDDVSPFSLDNKFYREQLEKNVVVNVLKNGKWGSFRGTPLHRPAPTDVAQILPHVHQVSEEVNIRYIGLNPAFTERRTKGTPAVLDYSGTTQSGGHVMGIAHKHEGFEGKILLNPVFQWTLPDSFTLTEAASIPSAYLMAHLIMKEIVMVPLGHTVFILNGQTPVSMALISLCLARNFEVFTTVPTEAARQLVSLLFPQIPESNITNHNSGDFYVPVMFKTKGVGARIVVSDLPYKQMLSAWKCSGRYGCFINLNDASMDHNAPLPMGMFSVSNGYYFYPLSKLARLPKQEKIQLHALVKESLSSMVHMPHQSMSIKDIGQLNSYVEKITEQGGKLLLDVGTNYKANTVSATTSNESLKEQIEWIADEHSQFSFVIISSSVGRSVNVVEWLLDRGVKNIVLSTLDADPSSDAVRKLNTSTSKHEATLLMTSAKVAHTAAGVEGVLNQARRLGKISTIFTISLVNNDTILPHIQKVMNVASEVYSIINIHRDPNVCEVENTVTILCDDEMDCSHVLSQAMTEPNKPATYVVSDAKGPGGSDADVEESIEDFLPSSLQQLEDMGRLLCLKDAKLSPHTSAIFMQTTSLAADMSDIQHGDALPVFFIPAFCETQLRPLLTRLMYPCFVAHVYPDGMSAEQVAAQLFESMIRIQSKGPYTIVSETWSGGVGMLLANLLTDSKQEVSLFLLHGIPTKMCSLLPLEDSLNEYVIKILHRLIEKEQPGQLKGLNGTKRLEAAVKLLPSEFDKAFVSRSLQTIQRSLHLTRSLSNRHIYLRSSLVAMEISQFCRLTIDELGEVSKSVQLVKIDCENYKEMLSHSRTTKLIAEEALFSW